MQPEQPPNRTACNMLLAEVVDFIFSFLQNDPAALKSCSAAHPLLSSLAERHLFVHIILYIGRDAGPLTDGFLVPQWSRCLSERPYLANRIRSITIDAHSPHNYPFTHQDVDILSTLLPSITHPEKLSLRNVRWSSLPERLRSSLLDFLQTTGMKGIHLQNSHHFPLNLLSFELKNIKNLEIDSSRCSFRHWSGFPIRTSLEHLSLGDLPLGDYPKWADVQLYGLLSLHVKIQPFLNLDLLFTACPESLTTLSLETGILFQTTNPWGSHSSIIGPLNEFPLNLSCLKSLELVTIHARISAETPTKIPSEPFITSCDFSLLAITELIVTAGPSLKRAVLNLDWTVCSARDLSDTVEWGALVLLFDSLADLQADLCIRASTASRVQLPYFEVADSLGRNKNLSKLVEKGSLVIKPFSSLRGQRECPG